MRRSCYLSNGADESTTSEKRSRWRRKMLSHLRTFAFGPDRRRYFRETVISKIRVTAYRRIIERGGMIPQWFRDVNDLNLVAAEKYNPGLYSGRLMLFATQDGPRDKRFGRDLGWGRVATDIQLITVPGSHRNLVLGNANAVAGIIAGALRLKA